MKRTLMVLVSVVSLNIYGGAFAAEPASKPDCAQKQKASDDAAAAAKSASTPDLSSCKDKKAKEKSDCEKPIKDKSKADAKAAKETAKQAKMALECCKNPKKKGCTP